MTKKIEFSVGFFNGFQQFFSGFTGPKRTKMVAILCARLVENEIFTKKNEGATLDPLYSGDPP